MHKQFDIKSHHFTDHINRKQNNRILFDHYYPECFSNKKKGSFVLVSFPTKKNTSLQNSNNKAE